MHFCLGHYNILELSTEWKSNFRRHKQTRLWDYRQVFYPLSRAKLFPNNSYYPKLDLLAIFCHRQRWQIRSICIYTLHSRLSIFNQKLHVCYEQNYNIRKKVVTFEQFKPTFKVSRVDFSPRLKTARRKLCRHIVPLFRCCDRQKMQKHVTLLFWQ